jgi:hypothetical protein
MELIDVRVLVGSTGPGSITFEVAKKLRCVVSEITEVDRFSALLQQQQPVEDLEQFCGGLVNPRWSLQLEIVN